MIEGADVVLAARALYKSYLGGDGTPVQVLNGVDLEVRRGESVAIIGESGSGKSTLLHLLGALDRPTGGEVWLGDVRLESLSDDEMSALRNERLGFIFQFHHLLREFTVVENVMMPQLIAGRPRREAQERARALLAQVGLDHRLEHKPTQISGGEQQRVAVARALANQPLVVLADEPSGNLDPGTSERLHDLLFEVGERFQTALVLVTHNLHLAARSDRVLEVRAGRLVPQEGEALEYAP